MAAALDGLDTANAQAWARFHYLANRFVADTHLATGLWQDWTAALEPHEADDLLERLMLLYDIVMPAAD